ncbi:MAG: hypothetical protein JO037_11205 [Actinobacteria bacterium]|nr:hypothetical protein [Actinomycetota bacterium]
MLGEEVGRSAVHLGRPVMNTGGIEVDSNMPTLAEFMPPRRFTHSLSVSHRAARQNTYRS